MNTSYFHTTFPAIAFLIVSQKHARTSTHRTLTSAGRYCDMFLCVECFAEDVACTKKGQCCRGQCSYGRCKGSSAPGDPGTFCDSKGDCIGDSCCVREPSVNRNLSICQPTLGESFTCVNRSQNVYVGGVEEVCGPCKAGLVCKTVGTFDVHEICLPK